MSLKPHQLQNLVCLFGQDVNHLPRGFFDRRLKDSTPVALDSLAIGKFHSLGLKWFCLDELFDPGEIQTARKQAYELASSWYEPGRKAFTIEGICWPELDFHAMDWFWQSFMLASKLACKLEQLPKVRMKYYQNFPFRPSVGYEPSDTSQIVWRSHLGRDRAVPLNNVYMSALKSLSSRSGCVNLVNWASPDVIKTIRLMKNCCLENRSPDYKILNDRVIFVINPLEVFRFSESISRIKDAFQNRISLFILSPWLEQADMMAAQLGIPVFCLPSRFPEPEANVFQKFGHGSCDAIESICDVGLRRVLKELRQHFHHFENKRWPDLLSQYRFFVDLWGKFKPRAIIVSALFDSESQIPAIAANTHGITSIAIPHGGNFMIRKGGIHATKVLYSDLAQQDRLEKCGVPIQSLQPCKGVVKPNEYPVQPFHIGSDTQKRILVLLDPVGHDGCLWMYTRHSIQIKAIKSVMDLESDSSQDLKVYLKVHPGWPQVEIIRACNPDYVRNLLPIDSDLHSVLNDVCLVIALNYAGSALCHVLAAGKPVIYYWTDSESGIWNSGSHFLSSGILVKDSDELSAVIKHIVEDPKFANMLVNKAVDFADKYLNDQGYPNIEDVVARIIA